MTTAATTADFPLDWRSSPVLQRIIAHYYILDVELDDDGEVKSRLHWKEISNSLQSVFNVSISVKSLKAHKVSVCDRGCGSLERPIPILFCRRHLFKAGPKAEFRVESISKRTSKLWQGYTQN